MKQYTLSGELVNGWRLCTKIRLFIINTNIIDTNIIIFDVAGTGKTAPEISERLMSDGIRMGAMSDRLFRAVTHLDVDADGVREAADAMAKIIQS